MRKWICLLAACCVMCGPAAALQDPTSDKTPPPRPPSNTKASVPATRGKAPIIGSVYIGDPAPDFVLDGSSGVEEQLSKHRGQWVLLVFGDRYRDLRGLDTLDTEAHKLDAHTIGVCHEKQQTLTSQCARDHVNLLLLADVTGEVAAVYGLYDWREAKIEPGFFVIDPQGMVRLAIIGRVFPADQMLELLRFATAIPE